MCVAVVALMTIANPSIDLLITKWANYYGANEKEMRLVMNCESGGNPKAFNPHDPNSGSYGLFQYQKSTFEQFAKEIGEVRDIWDVEAQVRLTAYAFARGRQSHWSCYKKLSTFNLLTLK